ncbi:UDP-N-acetylmuramoyl-L-alanyl-D-glutamate--2,6-diaminopimelate ligase [Flavobacterium sp.]|uniref:UDP-N-acetylmuramoyl-L-alanyl-D-glutamate--2, 6-diaminopimelate ligase n=1 Tax=Flavobacterium sp. TaxID=239 RepID=UPI003B9ADDEB
MKVLKDLLYKVRLESVIGTTSVPVQSLTFDSRQAQADSLFFAVSGTKTDGHKFIDQVIANGCRAIVCERAPEKIQPNVCYAVVGSTTEAMAQVAANFYDNPSQQLKLVGVTGTNGKTTVATLLHQLFQRAGFKTGLLSTVKIVVDSQEFPATHTTPDSISINNYLRQMVDAGVDYCFMEVSSHGIHQNRTKGLRFAGAIFTNLSHDHLDYHKTFSEYRDVKKKFFDELDRDAFALVNIDDKNGNIMFQNTVAAQRTYALKTFADFRAQILENQIGGLLLKVNSKEVWVKLIGSFNAYNILAIYGTAVLLGMPDDDALRYLSELESVSGRFQYFITEQKITVIVDYAHTPDALENVLNTINGIRTGNENLITVVGCGGDRDATKRPVMGNIATKLSNHTIFTSDNPRTENPDLILAEIEAGVEPQNFKKYITISDRKSAIKSAITQSNPGDIILIAGKGHETYQEINGVKYDFDDLEIAKTLTNQLNK